MSRIDSQTVRENQKQAASIGVSIPGVNGKPNSTPVGWDDKTYSNFKKANPTLEPTAQDTARMNGTITPTVITDTNLREKVIPRMTQDANTTLSQYDQNKAGAQQTQQTQQDKKFQQDQEQKKNDPFAALDNTNSSLAVDPYTKKQLDLIDKMLASSDRSTRALADEYKTKYERERAMEQQTGAAEQAGLRTGLRRLGSRYSPTAGAQTIATAQRGTLENLARIDETENSAIEELRAAQQNKDFEAVGKKLELLKSVRDDRIKALEAERKAKADAQKEVDDVVKSAAEGGAPREVLQAMSASKDVGSAIEQAGDYLQKASGTPGEYLFYKRDAIAKGQQPLSYNEYADMDANRKRSVTNISMGGLTNQQATLATKLSDDYEARSKDFYSVRDAYNRISESASNPSPAGDLSLIFNYMKMLDPGSTVREGEFATAANAGSIPTTIVAQYNKAINGQRLAAGQRADFVKRAGGLFDSAKKQQDVTAQEFTERSSKYGVPADLVVRSTEATGNKIINDEDKAQQAVISYGQTNPMAQEQIRKLAGVVQPSKGRAYTWQEIQQILGI
jgi:hypothetical protein